MQKAKAIPVDRANEVGFDSSDDETKIKQYEAMKRKTTRKSRAR